MLSTCRASKIIFCLLAIQNTIIQYGVIGESKV